jgi:hypothetical protein
MAAATEIASLEEINYKSPSKLKAFLVGVLAFFLLIIGFLNFYPVGDQLRKIMRNQLQGAACNPDWANLAINPLFAKITVTDLTLPASCFNRDGEPLKLSYLTINYHLISFFPIGLPFRIDTEMAGNPLSLYYVLGFGEHMVRIKDQKISLTRLMPLLAPEVKIAGSVTVDLNMKTNNQGAMTSLQLKAKSTDFEVLPQSIQELIDLPNLKIRDLFVEAHSDTPPRVIIDRLVIGNPESPIRANFKGRIDLQPGGAQFSPMDLVGELAFSDALKQTLPLDLVMGQFPQKDGFYQVRLGGTLGAPKGVAP